MCLQIDRSTAVGYFPGDWSAIFKCTFALAYVLVASYLVLFFLFWLCKSAFIDHPTTTIIVESSECLCFLLCIQSPFCYLQNWWYSICCCLPSHKCQAYAARLPHCPDVKPCYNLYASNAERHRCCGGAILVTSTWNKFCYLPNATSAYVGHRESKRHRSRCCCCC